MTNLCLFLKPQVRTAEGRERQREAIEKFIAPAIEEAKLLVIDNQINGLEVSDISVEMVKKVYKANVIVIDANCYKSDTKVKGLEAGKSSEASNMFSLSPYIYYYMAVGHSRGNVTILVANTTTHLAHSLITDHHTLTYATDNLEFVRKFRDAVEEIRQQQNIQPDNPLQVYLNQEELARTRRRVAELEAEKEQQRQGKSSIVFTRVNPKR